MGDETLSGIRILLKELDILGCDHKVELDHVKGTVTVYHPDKSKRVALVKLIPKGSDSPDVEVIHGEVDGRGKGSQIENHVFTEWICDNHYLCTHGRASFIRPTRMSVLHPTDTVVLARLKLIKGGQKKNMYRVMSGNVDGTTRGQHVDEAVLLGWIKRIYLGDSTS